MITTKRGRIKASFEIMQNIEVLKVLYTKITPYMITTDSGNIISPTYTIYAFSEEFDEVKVGELIPLYEVIFTWSENTERSVSITKCIDKEST